MKKLQTRRKPKEKDSTELRSDKFLGNQVTDLCDSLLEAHDLSIFGLSESDKDGETDDCDDEDGDGDNDDDDELEELGGGSNGIAEDDDDLEFVVNGPSKNKNTFDQRMKNDTENQIDLMNQLEIMGYPFGVDTDYEDSDELDSLDGDSDGDKEKFPKFNPKVDMKDPKFRLKMVFTSFQSLKEAIRIYSIKNRYSITIKKNDSKRVRAVCKKGCKWVLYATPIDDSGRVQIRTYIDEHSCSREFSNKFATKVWIATEYLEAIRLDPEMKTGTLQGRIKNDYNIIVKRGKVYKAKELALQMLRGDENEQFLKLADYGAELRKTNPGSTCILSLDNLIFKRMFVCVSGCKNGFKAGCRPIISIDGCFLKGRYRGHLLTATGIDPNDCIWPLAYAIVDVESTDSWTWFLRLLGEELEIENSHRWTFISDRQKGLISAVNELFPNSEHRFCVRYLISNFRKGFPGEIMKNTIWEAAKSSYVAEFRKNMERLRGLSSDAWVWMDKIPAEYWSKSHFRETSKCDLLLNNIAECFNKFILDARDKPILTMMEMIRCKIMVRIARKREQVDRWTGTICPKIQKKVNKMKEESRFCWPQSSRGTQFQVACSTGQFVVDIASRTCSCRQWQLTGIPCAHACATLAHNGNIIEDFVDTCYSIATWKMCMVTSLILSVV